MNSFSAELNFQACTIFSIACFKRNNFCFCYTEWNLISIKPKDESSKIFILSFANGTYAVLDV